MSIIRSLWIVVLLVNATMATLFSQTQYHYSYIPKTVYENQVFSLTVVGPDDNPILTFDNTAIEQPLFKLPQIIKNGKDTFYTFYFKAGKYTTHIPMLFITSDTTDITLQEKDIKIKKIVSPKFFSSVFATRFHIKNQQVSNYDGKNHIVTLQIEAYEANLEDIVLSNVNEYGIDSIKRNYAKVTAELYAVIPRDRKKLIFSYFNTIENKFITINVPVEVVNASVTTQSDLNPKVDAFERLKRYALIMFSLFFVIMFVWKRDFFYLILGVISIITLLTFYIPHKKICVKQGAPLYIIPTDTSTIGARVSSRLEDVSLLQQHDAYNKIEYKKGIIGWIKNEDICKN